MDAEDGSYLMILSASNKVFAYLRRGDFGDYSNLVTAESYGSIDLNTGSGCKLDVNVERIEFAENRRQVTELKDEPAESA